MPGKLLRQQDIRSQCAHEAFRALRQKNHETGLKQESTVSRLRAAKGLSLSAARCFAALSMTGLDLSVEEELSSAFEPCLNKKISGEP
jgi:hypothetical protein